MVDGYDAVDGYGIYPAVDGVGSIRCRHRRPIVPRVAYVASVATRPAAIRLGVAPKMLPLLYRNAFPRWTPYL